jgi:E3 ubiquitin-protein ligase RNF115/126
MANLCSHIAQIDPENDPRNVAADSLNLGPHNVDSDPDEEDLEEHVHRGPDGFFFRQTLSPNRLYGARGTDGGDDGELILNRFADMMRHDFGLRLDEQHRDPGRPDGLPGMVPGRGVRTTRFEGPGFSGTSTMFTFSTGGPMRGGPRGGPGMVPGMGFDELFSGIMGGPHGRPGLSPTTADGAPPPGVMFTSNLQQLFEHLMNPANAVHGDVVYSQEALDRIISQMMDANPQSNAAPPASETAIESLPTKSLDDDMIGSDGKADCTICMDEMKAGDKATVLPCKHWFHPDCVTLWLKQHNTCPICRTSIEPNGDGSTSTPANMPNSSSTSSNTGPGAPPFGFWGTRPGAARRGTGGASATQTRNQERLDAIRNLAGADGRPANMRRNSLSPPSPGMQSPASEYGSRTRVRSPVWSRTAEPDHDHSYMSHYGQGGNDVRADQPRASNLHPRPEMRESASGSSARRGSTSAQHGSHDDGNGGHGPMGWIRDQWNHFSRPSGSGSGR